MLYHGVRRTGAGRCTGSGRRCWTSKRRNTALLRGDSWIFGPEADYEREGDVGYVTFPAATRLAKTATQSTFITVPDTSVALATGRISQVLEWLDRHGTDAAVA